MSLSLCKIGVQQKKHRVVWLVLLVPLVDVVQMFKLVLLSMLFLEKCRMGRRSRSRCSRAAGTICQGITGAIRGGTIGQQAAVAGMPRQAATASSYNQKNHTAEQTGEQVVTLAPEPMLVWVVAL